MLYWCKNNYCEACLLKTHYSVSHPPYGKDAIECWIREGLLIGEVKLCNGLMVREVDAGKMTQNQARVTCKHCLNKLRKEKALSISIVNNTKSPIEIEFLNRETENESK